MAKMVSWPMRKQPFGGCFMRIVGIALILIGFLAILAEILDYPLLIYYGNPLGGLLGILGIIVGTILITLRSVSREIRGQKLNFTELYIKFMDTFSEHMGVGIGWFTTIMVVVVFVNVLLRYVFGQSLLALQDLSWYVFGLVFLIGAAYTLKHDRHVRVDIFYVNYPPKVKVWTNFLGGIFFLIPFCILGIWVSWEFVARSFLISETSPDAGGLAARYLAKTMIPIGFLLILLQGISIILKALLQLRGKLPIEEQEGAH